MNDMKQNECCYQEVLRTLFRVLKPMSSEMIGLEDGLGRVSSASVTASFPRPLFDESVRDGYVIAETTGHGESVQRYRITGEIPAGSPYGKVLGAGTGCRIMTGGCVPEGGSRVIPHEDCREVDGDILVEKKKLSWNIYIRRKGADISEGDVLVGRGILLQAGHLAHLASCGVQKIDVATLPVVGFFCTGSELRHMNERDLENGQKISSNSLLLRGLLDSIGIPCQDFGIIPDNRQSLLDCFLAAKKSNVDVLISTGGMGPGKYDLVEKLFLEAGGNLIFTELGMRPGKSVLFGTLGKTLFFGLPGPPYAVQTLFNLLVVPVVFSLQGLKEQLPRKTTAYLEHDIPVKRSDLLCFKDGVLELRDGKCYVRLADRDESPNCYIMLSAGQLFFKKGEMVEICLA
ncbi:molybdopterin molybdenumtransferase MoeA [Desulfomarina profundi]|uniref:Molybdopterin molybdenumtransferase n=1 Tax=Desulfomarina profundi TaxID=2772557 RepID=A0A8D5FJQ6_9BACT|nr:molybdopterin molybdotransferase MoeA [Desulfomarina profundi]BCL59444.1 molybdopterin molybdenumtransferase MoeA [Desulfomarina profundi]